jgi:hypothetical protein
MFEEPEEDSQQRPFNPAERATAKGDEFRMHAELCAIFEGHRKFDAEIRPDLDPQIARESQKTMGRLEKARLPDTPIVNEESMPDAAQLLDFPTTRGISTNDYHIYRRPGEAMILRWLAGEQVDSFYQRLQAHFDAALNQYREEEKQANGWKQDPPIQAYLSALDAIDIKMPDRYLRSVIREHKAFVLSTQSADEMDILHLCDFVMGVEAREIVGAPSAPPNEPSERDRAWYFKLFSLRGIKDGVEQMCFFTYLQKSDEF